MCTPQGNVYATAFNLLDLTLSVRRPGDVMHTEYSCAACIVPQHQLMLEMCHLSRDGGGQAVLVQDLHRAGAQEWQHFHTCAVRCEDLAAEERSLIWLNNWEIRIKMTTLIQENEYSFEKKGSTSAHIKFSHRCRYCRYVHYVVVVCLWKLYLQLVLDCITGASHQLVSQKWRG